VPGGDRWGFRARDHDPPTLRSRRLRAARPASGCWTQLLNFFENGKSPISAGRTVTPHPTIRAAPPLSAGSRVEKIFLFYHSGSVPAFVVGEPALFAIEREHLAAIFLPVSAGLPAEQAVYVEGADIGLGEKKNVEGDRAAHGALAAAQRAGRLAKTAAWARLRGRAGPKFSPAGFSFSAQMAGTGDSPGLGGGRFHPPQAAPLS